MSAFLAQIRLVIITGNQVKIMKIVKELSESTEVKQQKSKLALRWVIGFDNSNNR